MPESPLMNDYRSGDISIEIATAFAAVTTLGKSLGFDYPTFGAGLRCAAWVDLDQPTTSFCSFVVKHRDQLSPCGVVNFLGEHSARQAFDVEVFYGDIGKASRQTG